MRGWLMVALLIVGCGSSDSLARRPTPAVFTRPPSDPPAPPVPAPPPPPPAPVDVTLLLGGDVLPHRPMLDKAVDLEGALSALGPLFKAADGALVNYETTTGDPDHAPRLTYLARPDWMSALARSGIGAVTGANNHACDAGMAGLSRTLDAARAAGVSVHGIDERDPWRPRPLVEKEGRKVCVVAWTTLVNAEESRCARSHSLATVTLDRKGASQVARAIARAPSVGCDAVIAVFHGGTEYQPQTKEVLAMARQAANAGASAVVVHHPHIVSPVLEHATPDGRRVPIFPSVGNLVTNQGAAYKISLPPTYLEDRRLVCVNGWTRLGMLAKITMRFERSGASTDKRSASLTWGYHLLWIENEHAEQRENPHPKIHVRLLDHEEDRDIVARFARDPYGPTEIFTDPRWL